jgi:hypothetical protein
MQRRKKWENFATFQHSFFVELSSPHTCCQLVLAFFGMNINDATLETWEKKH